MSLSTIGQLSIGHIVNLVSNDAKRFEFVCDSIIIYHKPCGIMCRDLSLLLSCALFLCIYQLLHTCYGENLAPVV